MTTTNNLKIIVLRSKLLEGFFSVEKSVGGEGTSLPILRNVLMKVEGGKLVLSTTDLELVVEHSLACKVVSDGSFTVPFLVMSNIVKNLSSERITLERGEGGLRVVTDSYEATVQGQDADDFPIIPAVKNADSPVKLQAEVFREVLSSVVVATQYSDIRPEISGVFVYFKEGRVFFVATDSFRLAERVLGSDSFSTTLEDFSFIIPLKTVGDVLRIFSDGDGDLEVFVDPNQVLFRAGDKSLISRLVEGTFPDYKQIVPKEFSEEVVVDREEFLSAVKTVSSLSGKASDVTIRTGDNNKFLEVYTSEGTLGENVYKLPAKVEGSRFSVVFNWRYVLDGLKIYSGDEVVLGINGSDRPAGIRSKSEPFLIYTIMPIKS